MRKTISVGNTDQFSLSPKEAIGLSIIVIIFISFALIGVMTEPWIDELTTQQWTERSFSDLWQSQYAHRTYALLSKLSVVLFGHNIHVIRIPALIFSASTLVLAYFYGRLLLPGKWSWAVPILLAIKPEFLIYSHEARGYSGALFFACSASFLLLLRDPVTLFSFWLSSILFFLAYLLHPTGFLSSPLVLLIAVYDLIFSRHDRITHRFTSHLKLGLISLGVLAFLFYLSLPYFSDYIQYGSLYIPSKFLSGSSDVRWFPSFSSIGFQAHLAALLAARGVHGLPLLLNVLLALFGSIYLLRRNPR
ncbi:MAG: hypothetical protein KC964_27210, partial [Candidatus Omnitrophica bacterium]|nr:hypothetical protein [Candidatus Omnitrophota bacterium]